MALYRSYYDSYNRSRLIYETQLEEEAMDQARKAPLFQVPWLQWAQKIY